MRLMTYSVKLSVTVPIFTSCNSRMYWQSNQTVTRAVFVICTLQMQILQTFFRASRSRFFWIKTDLTRCRKRCFIITDAWWWTELVVLLTIMGMVHLDLICWRKCGNLAFVKPPIWREDCYIQDCHMSQLFLPFQDKFVVLRIFITNDKQLNICESRLDE